jgi:hypothetical protein
MFIITRRRTLGTLIVLAASVGTLTACGKSSTTEPATVDAAYAVSGDSQSTTVGTVLANPLVVRAFESNGTLASGVTVTWSVLTGGGVLSATSSVTGTDGAASVTFTPDSTGTDVVQATVANVATPIDFTVTATALPDSTTASGN